MTYYKLEDEGKNPGIASKLAIEIKSRGLSLRKLAEKSNVNVCTISRIISGKQKHTTYLTLKRLAMALCLDFNSLIGDGCPRMNYYELRNEGKSLDEIAEAAGYKDVEVTYQTEKRKNEIYTCIVYMNDGRETVIRGKKLFWNWLEFADNVCFFAFDDNEEQIHMAEFRKSVVNGIVLITEENDG